MEPDVQWFMDLMHRAMAEGWSAEITAHIEDGAIVSADIKLHVKPGDPLPTLIQEGSSALTL